MDEILVNKVLKVVGVKSQASSSSTGANNQVLSDETPQPSQIGNRSTLDTIIKSYSASQILSTYQLLPDEMNTSITNSFLVKGVLPSKEDIEAIRNIINNFSDSNDLEKIIDKAVNSKIRNLDSNHLVVKEAIENDLNVESLQKDLQKLKTDIMEDKLIPTKLKLDIVNTIDKTRAQIESIQKESAIAVEKSREAPIQERLITSANESGARKLERIIETVSKALVEIKVVLEDGIASQLQKDNALISTDALMDELDQIQNKLTSDRKSLLSQIEIQIKELVSLKENMQKVGVLFQATTEQDSQNASALLDKRLPEFLKTLNVVDTILAKFGEFISAYPQSSKTEVSSQTGQNAGLVAAENTPEDINLKASVLPLSQQPSAKTTPEVLPTTPNKSASQSSLSLLPAQLSNALEAIKVNFETIKGILNQTIELPPSVAIKQLISVLENKIPEFIKMFTAFGIDNSELPELKKLQDQLNLEKNKMDHYANQANSKTANLVEGANKTINLTLLKNEIEKLETELIKNHETIQSLKKNHEAVLKTESKQVIQQLLEKSPTRSEIFHAFEIRHNPIVEMQPTRVEVRQNKNTEDPNEKQSFSFLLDLDLTHVGPVKAQLYSSEKIKQINLFFENQNYKALAIENQSELQGRLREIPFLSQLFFSSAPPEKNTEAPASLVTPIENIGDHSFDSIA